MLEIKNPHAKNIEDVFSELKTSNKGLSEKDALDRRKFLGSNTISTSKHLSAFAILINQFKNPFIFLLIVASALSFFLGEKFEGFFIIGVIFVNAILGFWQEYKADNAVQKLENYIKEKARVLRDGIKKPIETSDITIGDYIYLKNGDKVPADIRIYKYTNLEADESILTGESLPSKKGSSLLDVNTPISDITNMLWAGTVVSDGMAEGIVVSIGKNTQIGNIASLVSKQSNNKTPLEKSIAKFTKIISILLVFVGITIGVIGLYSGYELVDVLILSIAIIVSAVPESLPIALSVVLAIGAESLAKNKAVVRKMTATETLGTTTLILTDKTGTLTEGKLSLIDVDTFNEQNKDIILIDAILNTDVTKDENEVIGRPLDIALIDVFEKRNELKELKSDIEIIEKLSFNSINKYTGALYKNSDKRYLSLLGAPDILLNKTSLSEKEKKEVLSHIDSLSGSGERIIGVVKMEIKNEGNIDTFTQKNEFTLSGLIRFRDPIRESVPEAVKSIFEAGVKTLVVTGDHPGTGSWVAKEIGLKADPENILTGKELETMSDEEIFAVFDKVNVFARVTPEQKLRLVQIYENHGQTVAVTGDGVNDAPALRAATIGVAMGSGTDVARASSDIVLLDNNYGVIVNAIFEGRAILRKIRTVIVYLLSDSFDEILLIGGALLLSLAIPLNAVQILYVKFFSDIFPAIALTFEKIDRKKVMKLETNTKLVDKPTMTFIFIRGFISSALLIVMYFYLIKHGFEENIVKTFIYGAFSSYLLFLAFSMRDLKKSIFSYNPFTNFWLNLSVFAGFGMIILSIYSGFFRGILSTTALPLPWFIALVVFGFFNFFLAEVFKYFINRIYKEPVDNPLPSIDK